MFCLLFGGSNFRTLHSYISRAVFHSRFHIKTKTRPSHSQAAEALGTLSPGEVTTLLQQLLQALPLPSRDDSAISSILVNGNAPITAAATATTRVAAAPSSSSETVVTPWGSERISETSSEERSGPSFNRVPQSSAGEMFSQPEGSVQTTGDLGASHPSSRSEQNCASVVDSRENSETTTTTANGDSRQKVPGSGDTRKKVPENGDSQNNAGTVPEKGYTHTDATASRLSSHRILTPRPAPPASKTENDSASDGWGRGLFRSIPSFKPPPAVEGLDSLEAAYIGSNAQNLLRLWKRAEEQGWAKVGPETELMRTMLLSVESRVRGVT